MEVLQKAWLDIGTAPLIRANGSCIYDGAGDWVLEGDDIAEVEELLTVRERKLCEVK